MKRFVPVVVGAALCLCVGCGKGDQESIQGTWTAVSMEMDSQSAPSE
jgi:hypothetical protein